MLRAVHRRGQRVAAISFGALLARGVHHGADPAIAADDPQGVSAALEDVEVAFAVDDGGAGIEQRGGGGECAVGGNTFFAVAGHHAGMARLQIHGVDTPQVGDVELRAGEIEGDAVGPGGAGAFRGSEETGHG